MIIKRVWVVAVADYPINMATGLKSMDYTENPKKALHFPDEETAQLYADEMNKLFRKPVWIPLMVTLNEDSL